MGRKGGISDTLHRHWRLLGLVPRRPQRIDTGRLELILRGEGVDVTRRSIQRDLESLAKTFTGLSCDARSKPFAWYWDERAPAFELPPMGLQTAVTLELVHTYLLQVLSRSTLRSLDPYFKRAREVLAANAGARMSAWPKKVRVIPRGQPLHPPDVPIGVLEVVYEALLEDRAFRARYRRRGAKADRSYDVSPLGLIVRNGTLMLVCTTNGGEQVKHMLLHRMSHAELLEARVKRPARFTLEEHVEDGGAAFRRGGRIRFKAIVHKHAAITLHETPLSRDQKIAFHDDEHDLVEATVADTLELRGWILGYGPLIEVVGPAALRKEIAEAARKAAAKYAAR